MHGLWHWILYVLTATSADPQLLEHERARAAGAVNVAYASLTTEPAPDPKKEAAPAPACPCGGKGYTMRADGSRWACKCLQPCATGTCPKR